MTNLDAKEEAIKKAYGEYFEQLTNEAKQIALLNNGWLHYDLITDDRGTLLNCIEMERDIDYYRPKSLQGIENNNGWIRIESESDLPKIGEYDMSSFILYYWTNNGLYRAEDYKRWKIHYDYLQVSHYRLEPIFKPKPPIY